MIRFGRFWRSRFLRNSNEKKLFIRVSLRISYELTNSRKDGFLLSNFALSKDKSFLDILKLRSLREASGLQRYRRLRIASFIIVYFDLCSISKNAIFRIWLSGEASPHNRLVREHRADFFKEIIHIIN